MDLLRAPERLLFRIYFIPLCGEVRFQSVDNPMANIVLKLVQKVGSLFVKCGLSVGEGVGEGIKLFPEERE